MEKRVEVQKGVHTLTYEVTQTMHTYLRHTCLLLRKENTIAGGDVMAGGRLSYCGN